MMDLDKIAGRMLDLESKYYDLQEKYQLLIHHSEDLKAEDSPSKFLYSPKLLIGVIGRKKRDG